VPVVEITVNRSSPRRGNVARNLRALESSVSLLGVLGDDDAGAELRGLLEQQGVDTAGLMWIPIAPRQSRRALSPTTSRWFASTAKSASDYPLLSSARSSNLRVTLEKLLGRHLRGLRQRRFVAKAAQHPATTGAPSAENYGGDPNSRQRLRYSGSRGDTEPGRSFRAAGLPYIEPDARCCATKRCCVWGKNYCARGSRATCWSRSRTRRVLFRPGKKPHHIRRSRRRCSMYRAPEIR